jgi:hypothetical protein
MGMASWAIAGLLATSTALAAPYRPPNFALPIEDGSGRVTSARDRVEQDPLNQVQPVVSEILFLDAHRALAYVAGGTKAPTFVITDYARREASTVELNELKAFYPRQTLLAGFRIGGGNGLTAVALQASNNESGTAVTRTTTIVVLYVFDGAELVSRSTPVEVEREEFAPSGGMPNATWYYLTPDSLESGERDAGVTTLGRVLIQDVNGDGFQDVVLWRKNFKSLPVGAQPKPERGIVDQYFDRQKDDLRVVTFDPATRSFSAPKPAERLAPPDESMWDAVPNLRYRSN